MRFLMLLDRCASWSKYVGITLHTVTSVTARLFRRGLATWLACFAAVVPAVEAPSDATLPVIGPASVLILPHRFDVANSDVARAAQDNLVARARNVLQADPRFKFVDQPALSASDVESLRAHFWLFQLVASSMELAKLGGKPWMDTNRTADYRIGDGLGFLADRTGARYALMIAPKQYILRINERKTPSMAGDCWLVELGTGRIVWFNKSTNRFTGSIPVGPDANTPDPMAVLLKECPLMSPGSLPGRSTRLVEADKPYVHRWVGYSVQFPSGWKYARLPDSDERGVTREGFPLQTIYVDFRSHRSAFHSIRKSSSKEAAPRDLAENLLADLTRWRRLEGVRLISNESTELDGRPAFRLEFEYMGPPGELFRFSDLEGTLLYREVVIGAVDDRGLYLVGYRAPFLHYFARDFGTYESVVRSFTMKDRSTGGK
jgi:hypothetical protein